MTRGDARVAEGLPRLWLERHLELRPVVAGVVCERGSIYNVAQNRLPRRENLLAHSHELRQHDTSKARYGEE